jgi:anti-anti-sigma factor
VNELAQIRVEERGTIVVVTVTGEIDVSNVDLVARRTTSSVENSATALLLDLSAVDFMDSTGVHMLYELAERLGRRQQRLAVVIPPGRPPRRTIELSGSDPSAWLHDDQPTALAALGDPG